MALPYDATGLSAVVIVVFPDHTHLLFFPQFTIYEACIGVLGIQDIC